MSNNSTKGKQLITREQFMVRTGVFITPFYFNLIYGKRLISGYA